MENKGSMCSTFPPKRLCPVDLTLGRGEKQVEKEEHGNVWPGPE